LIRLLQAMDASANCLFVNAPNCTRRHETSFALVLRASMQRHKLGGAQKSVCGYGYYSITMMKPARNREITNENCDGPIAGVTAARL
jgi:hypothetical protein